MWADTLQLTWCSDPVRWCLSGFSSQPLLGHSNLRQPPKQPHAKKPPWVWSCFLLRGCDGVQSRYMALSRPPFMFLPIMMSKMILLVVLLVPSTLSQTSICPSPTDTINFEMASCSPPPVDMLDWRPGTGRTGPGTEFLGTCFPLWNRFYTFEISLLSPLIICS